MRIAVVGSTRPTGRSVLARAIERGHGTTGLLLDRLKDDLDVKEMPKMSDA